MDKKYTIKDIANLAGVSKGTVDRVLHRRGKVSSKAQAQVEKVLEKIDYQPNPIARNLKNNKVYIINVLMPAPDKDPYWAPAVQGIADAAKEFKSFGLLVNKFYYNPYDQNSFIENSKLALEPPIDALLMAPLFREEPLEIIKECQKKNILVSIFNNFNESLQAENFIGQDSFQSGRVAANLFDKLVHKKDEIGVFHLNLEPHMKLIEKGFKDYFKDKSNNQKIHTLRTQTSDFKVLKKEILEFLGANSKISAVFITNSKAHLFLKVIEHLSLDVLVVGYDLLDENIELLKKGTIDFLIHHKPKRQAYLGVGYLAEHFLFGKPIPKQNLLPIDIITPENVKYYLD